MPVSVIPFKMPEPMEIPEHIVSALRDMAPDDAVKKGMELLLQIEAAETIVYERVNEEGKLELGCVVSASGDASDLEGRLVQEPVYGQPPSAEAGPFAGAALAQRSALLIMGPAHDGEAVPLPAPIKDLVLDGSGTGNVGFIYVLTFISSSDMPLGALTLIRSAENGPLNHDQPNITEALRQVLLEILDRQQPTA
jgi:hypothetical protein